jgi:adenylate cyclase
MSETRRLVTIFYADVAGYSRLTGADEVGTHRQVMAMLDDATARISAAGGTVLRYAGDAILATFPSVVLAVDTSAEIQAALSESQTEVAEDKRVQVRIGINLGDVIEDRGEVYGEGVNLAARLEAAAEPGGICISAAAHDQCRGKCVPTFREGGSQAFRNIAEPVTVFHWPEAPPASSASAATVSTAFNKPSVAVLPFANMSSDPEQEYFSDGITEDIITEVSRYPELLVTARNSSFVFKGQNVDIKQAGEKLGVQFVVEGSVRKAGNRARITAQLIEAATDNHIWAERYDRDLSDIFEVQDELARAVAQAVAGQVILTSMDRLRRRPTEDMTAYDLYLRSLTGLRSYRTTVNEVELLRKAIKLDPDFAAAHAFLATSLVVENFNTSDDTLLESASEHARGALNLDPNDARSHKA